MTGISRHGIPFLSVTLAVLVLAAFVTTDWTDWARYSLIFVSLFFLLLFLTFFRDPERTSTAQAGAVLAPADGRIVKISEATDETYPDSSGILVSIFMSLLNVHVNRAPVSGTVIRKEYRRGRFVPAFREEASSQNEQCSLLIRNDGKTIFLRQVAGILARRIITYPDEGDAIVRGDRLGMILFGSRLDIILPPGTEVTVSPGQKTVAGKTIVGVLS